MRTNSPPVDVVLRPRTLVPHGICETQTEILDRLQQLEADDRIDELDVDVWGASIGSPKRSIGIRHTYAKRSLNH